MLFGGGAAVAITVGIEDGGRDFAVEAGADRNFR
jgi:hypothetical protein